MVDDCIEVTEESEDDGSNNIDVDNSSENADVGTNSEDDGSNDTDVKDATDGTESKDDEPSWETTVLDLIGQFVVVLSRLSVKPAKNEIAKVSLLYVNLTAR